MPSNKVIFLSDKLQLFAGFRKIGKSNVSLGVTKAIFSPSTESGASINQSQSGFHPCGIEISGQIEFWFA